MLKPCKSTAAFEAVPVKNIKINLENAFGLLQKSGFKIINAKVMLIIQMDCEITLYPSGRLIIKTQDKETAEKLAEKTYHLTLPAQARLAKTEKRVSDEQQCL